MRQKTSPDRHPTGWYPDHRLAISDPEQHASLPSLCHRRAPNITPQLSHTVQQAPGKGTKRNHRNGALLYSRPSPVPPRRLSKTTGADISRWLRFSQLLQGWYWSILIIVPLRTQFCFGFPAALITSLGVWHLKWIHSCVKPHFSSVPM